MPYVMIKRIVRESQELEVGPEGRSIGEQIDMMIETAIDKGDEIGEINFGFEGDEWHQFAHKLTRPDPYGDSSGVNLAKARK